MHGALIRLSGGHGPRVFEVFLEPTWPVCRRARYNRRPQEATDWRLDVHAGPDFLDRMRREPPGGVAVFSGRNRGKIERIIAALETGLHVSQEFLSRTGPAAGPEVC